MYRRLDTLTSRHRSITLKIEKTFKKVKNMRAYAKERLENAIAYIITIHEKLAGKPATQTYIYKYLALIDFQAIKDTGKPVFDLDYAALPNGPIPAELYDNKDFIADDVEAFDAIKVETDSEGNLVYKVKKEPNIDYLSDYELDLIENILENHIDRNITTQKLSEITHKEIRAWSYAWKNRGTHKRIAINNLHSFENILDKDANALSPVEEAALVYDGLVRKSKEGCL